VAGGHLVKSLAMRVARSVRRAAAWAVSGGVVAGLLVALASVVGLAPITLALPVGIIVAAVFGATKFTKDNVLEAVGRATRPIDTRVKEIETHVKRIEGKLPELAAIAAFSAVDTPYPLPLGGWALSWDAAGLLAREVATGAPETVVELGSGTSTVIIGLQLRRTGRGHLFSLEHDPEYAKATLRQVVALGLGDWISVLDSPLIEQQIGGERFTWYSLPPEVRALDRIDLLLVDGPPQNVDPDGTPRYPALPAFEDKLGPGSLVFVDDASRETEKRMLERWATEQPQWERRTMRTERGTALLRWPNDRPVRASAELLTAERRV
jgi:predicted O-methyltransferase YrrM